MSGRNAPAVSRRGFISSAVGAAACAAMPSWAGNIVVPGYYSRCLDSVAGKIALRRVPADKAFRDGDRILFLGDSITPTDGYPQFVCNYYLTSVRAFQATARGGATGGWGRTSFHANRRLFP